MFSVNVIVYGNYPELAKRCLYSIARSADPKLVAEVRVGMNDVCEETRDLVFDLMEKAPCPFFVYQELAGMNVMKYPLMRRMIYDPEHPIPVSQVQNLMWFDDDSFIVNGEKFWADADAEFERCGCPMMGSVYLSGYNWTPEERVAIAAQPWFKGCDYSTRVKFVTGGWWVADLEFLAEVDYPFRELKHNGGDTILGEVVRQSGKRPHHYRDNVAINADKDGKESKSTRRGVTTQRPFQVSPPYDYSHHDFQVRVRHNLGT
jgi:hypothetical protein